MKQDNDFLGACPREARGHRAAAGCASLPYSLRSYQARNLSRQLRDIPGPRFPAAGEQTNINYKTGFDKLNLTSGLLVSLSPISIGLSKADKPKTSTHEIAINMLTPNGTIIKGDSMWPSKKIDTST